jgi:hypothetical protein
MILGAPAEGMWLAGKGKGRVSKPVSADRARLAREIGKIERQLDQAMNLLGKTQRAMVEAGAGISAMHQALHGLKEQLGEGSGADA